MDLVTGCPRAGLQAHIINDSHAIDSRASVVHLFLALRWTQWHVMLMQHKLTISALAGGQKWGYRKRWKLSWLGMTGIGALAMIVLQTGVLVEHVCCITVAAIQKSIS